MSSDNLNKFYHSARWKKTRNFIKAKYHGVCAECGLRGNEVHHIKPLTVANIDDYNISLNPDNLVLLCTSCHNAKRSVGSVREDLFFDDNGNVLPRKKPPPNL